MAGRNPLEVVIYVRVVAKECYDRICSRIGSALYAVETVTGHMRVQLSPGVFLCVWVQFGSL
jgi:hypothetical protein